MASIQPNKIELKGSEMMPEVFDSLAPNYESAFGHDPGLLEFIQVILQHVPLQATILDFGCGTGRPVASTLASAGHQITGVDISPEMIRLCRSAVPTGIFEIGDMNTYTPSSDTQFDCVMSIFSFFPFERHEIEAMIAKWSDYLREDGLICIATVAAEMYEPENRPNGYDADGRCAQGATTQFMGHKQFITMFTTSGLKGMLADQGFEVVHSFNGSFVPPPEHQSDTEHHVFCIARKVR